jgi:hypothetical protein
MQSIYNHLDFKKVFKTNNKLVYINRLTVKNYLNFIINYRAWIFTADVEALKELINDNCSGGAILEINEMNDVAMEIHKMIPVDKQDENENTENTENKSVNWLSKTIAFFALNTGYKKDDVLNLFLDEVESIIDGIKEQMENNYYRNFQVLYYAERKPELYFDEVYKKNVKQNHYDKSEMDALRKEAREWMQKHNGEKNAVK